MAAALEAQTLSFLPAATDKAAWFKCGTSDFTQRRVNVRDQAKLKPGETTQLTTKPLDRRTKCFNLLVKHNFNTYRG